MDNTKPFRVGDVVETECADWAWDNPMVVIEESHTCHCGCGFDGMITARGKSGKTYEEVEEAFDWVADNG